MGQQEAVAGASEWLGRPGGPAKPNLVVGAGSTVHSEDCACYWGVAGAVWRRRGCSTGREQTTPHSPPLAGTGLLHVRAPPQVVSPSDRGEGGSLPALVMARWLGIVYHHNWGECGGVVGECGHRTV